MRSGRDSGQKATTQAQPGSWAGKKNVMKKAKKKKRSFIRWRLRTREKTKR